MDETTENIEAAGNAAGDAAGEVAGDMIGAGAEMSDKLWHLGETYGVPLLTVLVIIFIALIIASWVSRVVKGSCAKAKLDETLSRFLAKVARWAVMLIAALFCLGKFGIDVSSFAVILGAAGLAIGLAFQGTLANIAAGVMLLIFRPFKVDDVVSVGGETGKVNEIELFTTTMDTPDNRRIIIPNGSIFGSTILNITHHPTRRVDVAVGVDYSADIDKVRSVLEQAAQNVPDTLSDPAPAIVLVWGVVGGLAGPRVGEHLGLLGREAGADPLGEDGARRGRHRHPVPADGRACRRRRQRLTRKRSDTNSRAQGFGLCALSVAR